RDGKAPAPGPVKRWVAVMFSDIVDSTRLAEEVGDDEWTAVVSRYREFVRAAFATRGGTEVGTQGDGFLAQFPSPADAVLCAVEIQRDVQAVAAAGRRRRVPAGRTSTLPRVPPDRPETRMPLATAARALLDERRPLTRDEVAAVAALPLEQLPDVVALAHRVRLAYCGPEVELESLIN